MTYSVGHTVCGGDVKYSKGHAHHTEDTEDTYVDRAVHRAELILLPSGQREDQAGPEASVAHAGVQEGRRAEPILLPSGHREDQAGPEASAAHEEEELRVLSLIQRQR